MHLRLLACLRPQAKFLAAGLIGCATSLAAEGGANQFSAMNEAAMAKMMAAMSIAPSADADVDFVALMVPHHQGAIEMAQAELRYGRNPELRRMAQEIIVTQLQEIAAMRLALGEPPADSAPSAMPNTAARTDLTSVPRPAMNRHEP